MEIVDLLIWSTIIMIQGIILFFVLWILRKKQIWPLIRMGLSGKGSLAQRFNPDNTIEFIYSGKPIEKIPWKYREPNGKVKKYYQPIEDVKHTLKGTSIPIHLCPFNTATNVSLLGERDKELTAKETNELAVYSYMQGVTDTRTLLNKPTGFGFDVKTIAILAVILLVAMLAWPQISASMGAA